MIDFGHCNDDSDDDDDDYDDDLDDGGDNDDARFVTSKNPEEWARAKDQFSKVATIMFFDHHDENCALIMVMTSVLTIMAMVTNMGLIIQQHKSRLEPARARLTTWHSTGLRRRRR